MAVSKRLRYEVLRRDNHTCRYCGSSAPDVKLTVDHVTPTTLGGSDDPSNLVAACVDCNSGKSATPPGAPLVEDVQALAVMWSAAMQTAHKLGRDLAEAREVAYRDFDAEWGRWSLKDWGTPIPRPDDWRDSIDIWMKYDIPRDDYADAVDIAMRSKATLDSKWRYFCGVMWRMIEDRQKIARQIFDGWQADGT